MSGLERLPMIVHSGGPPRPLPVRRQTDLIVANWVQAIRHSSGDFTAMKHKPGSKADPIELEIERALRPGAFIRDGECCSFVSTLEEVAATIDKLISTDPMRAVDLWETFLAGCHAKADELDDSSGSFGQFAQDVICG